MTQNSLELDNEIEDMVLKESITNVFGLNSESLQVGLRGDPSLRETTGERKRYRSSADEHIDELMPVFEELLLNRSTYRLFVGFNNGEIRMSSVFDPLVQEIHAAEKLIDPAYLDRQFPKISYAEKVELIRDLYRALRANPIYQKMPGYWRNIMIKRSQAWEPMEQDEIRTVVSTLKTLREMPVYYLRNVTLCIVQSTVRLQFNCDGTQIVSAENYKRFLEQNMLDAAQ